MHQHDATYCKQQIVDQLLGGTILGVIEDEADPDFYGIRVVKDGKMIAVWIQSDAEANAPGWIDVEEMPKDDQL